MIIVSYRNKEKYFFFPLVQLFLRIHPNSQVDGYIQKPFEMEHHSDSDLYQDSEIEIFIDEDSQVTNR